jgi:hypothetical protein
MRTAVIRVNVDPLGTLAGPEIERGLRRVLAGSAAIGLRLVGEDLGALPPTRRELQFLGEGDPSAMGRAASELCREAFGTEPAAGPTTFVSRGTDDDAAGVLAGFGLTGEVTRAPGADDWDVVTVRLTADDLRRVPESRIATALEASLNCEVRIVTT